MEKKTIAALGLIGVVASGAVFGAIGHYSTVPTQEEIKALEDAAIAKQPVIDTKAIEASAFASGVASVKPTTVEVIKTVTVESDAATALAEYALNGGDVSELTDDLDEKDVKELGDRAVTALDIKALAAAEVKSGLADLVDKEMVNGTRIDDNDVERVRVKDDVDEVQIVSSDFDDGDFDVSVDFTFEQDDVKYKGTAIVSFKDGEFDDLDLDSLSLN